MRTFRLSGWELVVRRRNEQEPSLGGRVKVARIVRGWSQEDLAREVGYSVRTIRRWEEGAQPRPRGRLALAEALDLNLANEREAA